MDSNAGTNNYEFKNQYPSVRYIANNASKAIQERQIQLDNKYQQMKKQQLKKNQKFIDQKVVEYRDNS